jgi:hypothetical protein
MSTNTLTFAEVPPRRPGLDDVGGGHKVNGRIPPDPARDLTAEDANQTAKQIVALAGITPLVILQMTYGSGTYQFARLACAIPDLTIERMQSDWTVTINGVGDVTITWPTNTFPQRVAEPEALPNGANHILPVAQAVPGGVRVRLKDLTSTSTHAPFILRLY